MKSITLTDGTRVELFEPPPPEFNLSKASPRELFRHGFPPMPSNRTLQRRYVEVLRRLSPKLQWVEPDFEVLTGRGPGKPNGARRATLFDKPNWCGVEVGAPAGDSVSAVTGSWVIPNVSKPTNKHDNYSCHWVGIDGIGIAPLFQAGVECDIKAGGSREFYAWYEWLLDNPFQVKIKKLDVTAGDYVTVMVCSDNGAGSTGGTVYFTNSTSGQYTSFRVSAPNSALVGATGEWVSEITQINGVIDRDNLADFGEVFFSNAFAATTKSGLLDCLNGAQLEMQDPVTLRNYGIGIPIASTVVQTLYETSS